MPKKTFMSFDSEDFDYTEMLNTLKAVIKQNEADKAKLQELQLTSKIEESKLQHYLHTLNHIKEQQHNEFTLWQEKAKRLEEKEKELERLIKNQAYNLEKSRANLESGLRMINLIPSSTAEDYLANTSLEYSSYEGLRSDWSKVGDLLAKSYIFTNKTLKQK